MTKWEYLSLGTENVYRIVIDPSSEIELQWLKERFPNCKIGGFPEDWGEQRRCVTFKNYAQMMAGFTAMLAHLGAEGWEGFAFTAYSIGAGERVLLFKRPLQEAT